MKRIAALAAALVLVTTAVAGCGGSRGKQDGQPAAAAGEPRVLQQQMGQAVTALNDLAAGAEAGNVPGTRQAYQVFATAFGQVLGPMSFRDVGLAQGMANANTALQGLLEQRQLDQAKVAQEVGALRQALEKAAGTMGFSLSATATAQVGAELARGRVIEIRAKEYRFEPARIEVKKGETVTIRFTNAGTEKHEWELEAFGKEIKPIAPGQTRELTFTPDRVGNFEFACHVDDHYKKGMFGFLVVQPR
jgi:plastocyanin